MATKPKDDNEKLAKASRDALIRALAECREQLRRAEAAIRRTRQDNAPTN